MKLLCRFNFAGDDIDCTGSDDGADDNAAVDRMRNVQLEV